MHANAVIGCLALALLAFNSGAASLTFPGKHGPGKGKRVVLIAGDDEYHSEEMLPQLAKILAERNGFDCTVLFSINPADGTIDPHARRNIPGLEILPSADLLILFTRFRDLPDDQMKYLFDYVEAGKPIIGLRTATHPFQLETSQTYARYSWNSKISGWEGGFGRRFLGETWVAHHGNHGKQGTRGMFASAAQDSPLLRGIKTGEIVVPVDVYEIRLPPAPTLQPLLLGQVLSGLKPTDPPVAGRVNDPMLPVAWTYTYTAESGKTGSAFVTTLASSDAFLNPGLRRLLVNAAYWAAGLPVPSRADVRLVGTYHPRAFLDTEFTRGLKPPDLER
jgi:hypothetical protein